MRYLPVHPQNVILAKTHYVAIHIPNPASIPVIHILYFLPDWPEHKP